MTRGAAGLGDTVVRAWIRAVVVSCFAAVCGLAAASDASAETRTLKLYYIHTGERAEITFKKDGKYIKSGLDKLNRFLRDWRRNEPAKMDPQLFDIVWEAYRMSGSREYINVVSAYRARATNDMLRRTRGGQAENSQHILGKAMDFYIPGVKLSKLREIGFKLQGGGVGYYPKSGSPFVHFDTGNVRAWPRMSRDELARVFPNGKTLHLPADGKPLPGYQQAMAEYKARKSRGQATAITSGGGNSGGNSGGGRTLLAGLFGGGADEEEDNMEAAAPAPRPTAIVQAAPGGQPELVTPGSLIAALAPTETPLPQFAPREQALVQIEQPQTAVMAAAPTDQSTARAALGIPMPTEKPVLLASTEVDTLTSRRSAAEIEAALNAAAVQPAAPAATVEAMIAAAKAEPVGNALRIPIPTPAPRPGASPAIAVASLEEPAPLPVPAPQPQVIREAALSAEPQVASISVTPQQRPEPQQPVQLASLQPEDPRVRAAFDSGVGTTSKTARPTLATASTGDRVAPPPAELIPVDEIDPSRFGSWTTANLSITDYGRPEERPVFMQNALREAPTEVYTEGFRHNPTPDPRRFSGNAVNFLTIAKFGGTGGDGQPLTLQIPATN